MRPSPSVLSAVLAALVLSGGCAIVNAPLLAIHGVTGMHHKTRAVAVAPFYTPTGRLGWAGVGLIWIEPEPGEAPVRVPDPRQGNEHLKADDPVMDPEGERLYFISGIQQVTSGGAHNDHVWQIYSMLPGGLDIQRQTDSRRKEDQVNMSPDGKYLCFSRRTEFRPYTVTEEPWGRADLILHEIADGDERELLGPRFDAYRGIAFSPDGNTLWFAGQNGRQHANLYRLDLRAEEAEPELVLENGFAPEVLPDGRVAYARRAEDGKMDVYVGDSPDELPLRVYELDLDDIHRTALSPDGTRLALGCIFGGKHGEWVLLELELDTGELREVTRHKAVDPILFKPFDYVSPIV